METNKPKNPEQQEVRDEPDAVSRFLWWLATVDPEVVKDCGSEKERYRIVGISVLITWVFATLAWGYFFSTVTDDDLVVDGLALFFGFAILAIDRSLIAAMSKKGKSMGWMPVAFRLALAVTIGMFLSQPIILMLFKKDIATQIELNKEKKLQAYRQKLTDLNAPLVAQYQANLTGYKKQLKDGEDQVKGYKDSYIKETDGTGGSGKIGAAAVAKVKKSEYMKSEEAFGQTQKELAPKIGAMEDSLKSVEGENKRKEGLYSSTLTNGFLTQVEALNDLLEEHPPLRTRYRLVILIITLIEVMPVLSKLLMPKGEYEERIAQRTALGMYKAELETDREKALQEHYSAQSLETDKASIDQFFTASRKEKERMGSEVIGSANGHTYTKLWQQFRKRVFSKKEL